jgi:hypothetical protein
MTDEATPQQPTPDPGLRKLDLLIGPWSQSPEEFAMSSKDSSTPKPRTEESKRSYRDRWESSLDSGDRVLAE